MYGRRSMGRLSNTISPRGVGLTRTHPRAQPQGTPRFVDGRRAMTPAKGPCLGRRAEGLAADFISAATLDVAGGAPVAGIDEDRL